MSKELEALNKIQHDFGQLKGQELVNCYETIFKGLKRLEAIDNASPSEALEELEKIKNRYDMLEIKYVFGNPEEKPIPLLNFNTIKQALLKAQEQEKVLKIIKKKKVNIDLLYASSIVEQYNDELVRVYGMWFVKDRQLTKDEFDALKRVL